MIREASARAELVETDTQAVGGAQGTPGARVGEGGAAALCQRRDAGLQAAQER